MPVASAFDRADLLEKAARLVTRGDLDAAIRDYTRLFEMNPRDLAVGNTLGDLYVRRGAVDQAAAQFMTLAAQLSSDGFAAKARALYKKVLRLQPGHALARQRIDELETEEATHVTPFLQRVLETARASRETAAAAKTAADAHAESESGLEVTHDRSGGGDDEFVCAIRIQPRPAEPPSPPAPEPPAEEVTLAPPAPVAPATVRTGAPRPDDGRQADPSDEWSAIDLSTVSEADEPPRALDEVRAGVEAIDRHLDGEQAPDTIEVIEERIGVAVDAGEDASALAAQVQLAEACLVLGRYQQARWIAEDLLDREPEVAAHRTLFDRATELAGEHGVTLADAIPAAVIVREPARVIPIRPLATMAAMPTLPAQPAALPEAVAPAHTPPPAPMPPAVASQLSADELLVELSHESRVFDDWRDAAIEVASRHSEQRMQDATRYADEGNLEAAAQALEEAMCTPALRAAAGSRLAHLLLDQEAPIEALACLEWVAEMPPSTEDGGHELAYDLALVLEALGEQAQALGVYRELLAEVGPGYRDVAARAERLAAA